MKTELDLIRDELKRRPLYENRYRKRTGDGISQAFGVVGRRSLAPDYSRWCWKRPYLYKLLMDFGEKYVEIPWNAITVNMNYAAGPHYDKNNVGNSFLVAFGDYTGGELKIHEGEHEGLWDICEKPIILDFSHTLHSVEPFSGERFSLVFYQYDLSWYGEQVVLPPPSVRLVDHTFRFFRGEEMIEEGLPHPLRGRKRTKPGVHPPTPQPSEESKKDQSQDRSPLDPSDYILLTAENEHLLECLSDSGDSSAGH